jgi:homoserine dehydrogenase
MSKKLKIGLFGYGVVGHGIYEILSKGLGFDVEIVKICVKNPDKKRDLPMDRFTFDRKEIIDNPEVSLIVEVINDAEAAYEIVTESLAKGKNVVTANKKMIAENLAELIRLQKEHNVSLLYEGSTCGSIPIIRTLEEYYDNELLYSVSGIFNSSSNYIVSRIFKDNIDFDIALKQAQDLGFLETDPSLDLSGMDALYKACIIAAHAYGVFVKPETVLNHGIQNLNDYDIQYAKEKGVRIKTVSMVKKINDDAVTIFSMPQFIPKGHKLYFIENELNAVIVEASFSDQQFYMGKGAGGHPIGSAILSDISANLYGYRYEYKKYLNTKKMHYVTNIELEVYLRYFDEKNVQLFEFDKITERYYGPDSNYVVGTVKLENLLKHKDRLNSADVLMVWTGKWKVL